MVKLSPPQVFVSYTHDSPEHDIRVLALADRLRSDGIDAELDQYEVAPAEGWTRWMRSKVKTADFVLLICTATYQRRAEGTAEPEEGRGGNREGLAIDQSIYESDGRNEKFIAVVFEGKDRPFIPDFLRPYESESIETEKGYERLYRRLTSQREVLKPGLGKLRSLPPRNRRIECNLEGAKQDLIEPVAVISERAISRPIVSLVVGETISHYRIVGTLGRGGMGMVYKAKDLDLGRFVALKFLLDDKARDSQSLERFRLEARAASALSHPNICTIYEIGRHGELSFIAMEFLEGLSMKDRLMGVPLDCKSVLDLGIEIAEALDAAHEKGIIHRDIKPGNIFLALSGHAKILDFGLATMTTEVSSGADTATDLSANLTRPGALLGTLSYMSPEQVSLAPLDRRTDLFSFGAVLYEMTTGRMPFDGTSSAELISAILRDNPRPPSELNPMVPPPLDAIIRKAMDKDRNLRYQRASEMSSDLKRLNIEIQTGRGTAAEPDNRIVQRKRLRNGSLAVAALLMAGLLAAGVYVHYQPKRLTEKDTIVIADFDNKTGDPVFDDALKQGLADALEQSPFLSVLSNQKVNETLAMMGRPANERITEDVSAQICQRTGSKAVLSGAIAPLGSDYVIDLNVVACDGTGKQLARAQIEANSKEGVLPSLSRASEKLRLKLGESLPTVQKFGVPIQASTSSLEALQNYSKGMKTFNEQGEVPSIPFLKRAIEIDPNFSVAYAALAAAYANLGQQSQAEKYATKAYELRDRATELEKLRITAFYFASRGELDKEIATYQLWTSIYPRDWAAHNNLGYVYANSMGDYSKALAEFQEALRLAPDKLSTYEDLGLTYMNLNRLNDAKAVFEKALANKLDGGALRQDFYLLAFLLGDTALMAQQVEWCSGKPGVEDTIFSMESDTEAYYGRFSKARERTRQAIDSAIRNKDIDSAVSWRVNSALREAEVGNSDSAKLNATESLKISAGRVVKMRTALALARGGEGKVAKTLAEETQKSNESSLMLRVYWLPTVNAASELSVGDSINALISLESPAPYELRQAGNLYPIYLRGQAYLMAQNGPAAAAEFQNILSHRGIVLNFVIGALTHLQLGRAYALEGNPVKARDAYQDFLSLWKDADSDIPIYKQAKAEYAKLQ